MQLVYFSSSEPAPKNTQTPFYALSKTPGYLANCSPSPFGEGRGEAVRGCVQASPPTLSYPMNSIPTWKTMALTTQARSVV